MLSTDPEPDFPCKIKDGDSLQSHCVSCNLSAACPINLFDSMKLTVESRGADVATETSSLRSNCGSSAACLRSDCSSVLFFLAKSTSLSM